MSATLLIDRLDRTVEDVGNETFEVVVASQPSPDHDDRNEDAAGIWFFPERSAVFAVADGMGGTPAGRLAARIAIEHLDESLRQVALEPSRRSPILDAFEGANAAILDRASGSGTTLVVAELIGSAVRVYNVGDSGALMVGQRGRIKVETMDHSPVGYGVAAGLIDSEEAMQHEDRHYLFNHLGSRAMHIEVGSPQEQASRDTLLLASDGLFDNVSPTEVIETIRCGPLRRAAEKLAEQALARMREATEGEGAGKPDDLTIVLARRRTKR